MTERHSQQMRRQALEVDALRLGIGWPRSALERPLILVETVGGDSHPGSVHLGRLADAVVRGFGRWAFLEIADPWDAQNMLRAMAGGLP